MISSHGTKHGCITSTTPWRYDSIIESGTASPARLTPNPSAPGELNANVAGELSRIKCVWEINWSGICSFPNSFSSFTVQKICFLLHSFSSSFHNNSARSKKHLLISDVGSPSITVLPCSSQWIMSSLLMTSPTIGTPILSENACTFYFLIFYISVI